MTSIDKETPLISTVIPAYNENQGITETVKQIAAVLGTCDCAWEIIVVDDGSYDLTYQRICRLSEIDPRIKGISLSRNFGKEAAMLAGLEYASGDAVIVMDADLQHPPSLIPEMIDKWRSGVQIVHGVKRCRKKDPVAKKAAAFCINRLISNFGGINLNNSTDFKLLDKEIVDIIVYKLPERERFFRGLTSWLGFSEDYLYFDVASRQGDSSKWSFGSLFELSITALTSLTCAPLRIVTFLGVATLLLGFLVAGYAGWSLIHDQPVSGYVAIIICLLLIGSFVMISLGIIGEYIAKIYEEVKARPHYLIKASVSVRTKNYDTSLK
jgi:glycosyltransferase involved in cell wall biosynthesis